MEYGQIGGNSSVNTMIYDCFTRICQQDVRSFVKKFREQPHDSDQWFHTFRELILGAYLSSTGLSVRYDRLVDGQTPDWCIFDAEAEAITGIVELVNFHIDKTSETEIKKQIQDAGIAVYWRDQHKDNLDRLYDSIWGKATIYKSLVVKLAISYVVAVFAEFEASVDFDEVRSCVFDDEIGLFKGYPQLSGVLFFEGSSGRYSFDYAANPDALRAVELPRGIFPLGAL